MSDVQATGVIVDARGVMDILVSQIERYKAGEITTARLDAIAYRVHHQLTRACWCAENVCCLAHRKHVDPHQRCLLR